MCAPFRVAAALLFAGIACGKNEAPVSSQFTLHYHRPLADYDGWAVQTSAGANEATAQARTPDGFGAVYTLTLKDKAPKLDLTLAKSGQTDAAGPLSVDVSGSVREAWVISAYPEAITRKLPALPAANQAALYYLRRDTSYSGWGLHVWGERVTETQWAAPLASAGVDPEFGSGFLIPLKTGGAAGNCPSGQVCFIVHSGDNKDPGPDMRFDPATLGNLVFAVTGSTDVTAVPRKPAAVVGAAAHLIARDTLVWNVNDPSANSFELRYSPTAEVTSSGNDVTGGSTIALTPKPAGLSDAQKALVPHLATYPVFNIAAADLASVEPALRGQIIAVARKADGSLAKATQVQTAFALDDLYAYDGPLGITFSGGAPALRLWAPSARAVKLFIYDASTKAQIASADPSRDAQGVWTASGPAAWTGQYYRYELDVYHPVTGRIEHVTVTDPYAVNVDTNGKFAQIVDLSDPALKPANWDVYGKPRLDAPEDIVLYESHVRDFSAFDATVPSDHRGKYLAFTDVGTDGIKHLDELNGAGLTHIHLLPAFDFATIDEDPANRVDVGDTFDRLCAKNASVPAALCTQFTGKTIAEALASFAGDSDQQQAIAGYVRGLDSFNWGYDPFHYGVPEGSYASTAEGTAKILEFRQMVMALNDRFGLSVVMDVVYNHTNASGLAEKSVLDKVVPWYYHRLDPETGAVLTSSCCANTATEHHMMEKLMIDTLVRWARDYKVDGFRFDLMGLHLKANMIHVRDALAALTLANDGVDGSKIYLYGEGWDMGEMANGGRGVNANQVNMAGTGIGTFNDRLRDAARGGGPFDSASDLRKNQGLANGLFLDPNELSAATQTTKDALGQGNDRIKIGMAGNLERFRLVNDSGTAVFGGAVGYGGQGTGYTADPQEAINYVSAHDNQTLWDIYQYKLPTGTAIADRVRAHDVALDTVLLGEGIPFFHMGDDILRSKSMDGNSYDSGDWFNRVDWTLQSNNWRVGLPGDSGNWPVIRPILADATTTPGPADIAAAYAHFREMLQIRTSSPLFRLRTKDDVATRVDYRNAGPSQVPGVIVMTITDGACAGADLDPQRDAVVVILNPDKAAHTMTVTGASGFTLHAVQTASADPVVKTASVSGADFTVPARTTAVFEQLQGAAQGAGLPCNTH